METIIQQIAKKLINKILEKAYSGGISDIDALSSAVLGDCKEAAVEMIEEITVQLNRRSVMTRDGEKRKALSSRKRNEVEVC